MKKNNRKLKRILGMITVFGSLLGVGIVASGSVQAESQPELVTVADTKQKLFADILNMINVYAPLGDLDHIYDYIKDALINAKNKGIITDPEFNREFGNLADFKNSLYDGQNLPELLGKVSSLSGAPDNFGKYIIAFQKVSKQVNSSWNNFWDVTPDNCESMLFAAICLAQEYYIADEQAREQATKVRQQALKFAIRVFEKNQEPLKKYSSVMSLIYALAGQQRKSMDLTSFIQSEINRNNTQLTDIQGSMDSKSDKLYHSAKIHQQLASLYDLFAQINYAQNTETYAVNIKRIFSRYEHAEMLKDMAELATSNDDRNTVLPIKRDYTLAQKYYNDAIDCLTRSWADWLAPLDVLDELIDDQVLSDWKTKMIQSIEESQINILKIQAMNKQSAINRILRTPETKFSSNLLLVDHLIAELDQIIDEMVRIPNHPQQFVEQYRQILERDLNRVKEGISAEKGDALVGEGTQARIYELKNDHTRVARFDKETPEAKEVEDQAAVKKIRDEMWSLIKQEKELSDREKKLSIQGKELSDQEKAEKATIVQEKAKIVESITELGPKAEKADQKRLDKIRLDVNRRSMFDNPAIMSDQLIIDRAKDAIYNEKKPGVVVGYTTKTRFLHAMRKGEFDASRAFFFAPWQFRLELTKDMISDLISGLVTMNKSQLVHLDIKPGNLVLVIDEKTNRLMLCYIDFGFVHQVGELISDPFGTPLFVPPELVLASDGIFASSKMDVYSLGTSIIGMLLEKQDYLISRDMGVEKLTEDQQKQRIIAEKVKEDGKINRNQKNAIEQLRRKHINPALVDLLAKMVAFDPAQRPTPQKCSAEFQEVRSVYRDEATVTAVTSDADTKKNQYAITKSNYDDKAETTTTSDATVTDEYTIFDLIREIENRKGDSDRGIPEDSNRDISMDVARVTIINSDGSIAGKFGGNDFGKNLSDLHLQQGQTIRISHIDFVRPSKR